MSGSGEGGGKGRRLFVERSSDEPYLQMRAGIAPHIKIGDPFDRSTIMGPVISEAAVQRIVGVVEAAQRDGARLVAGGARLGGEHADEAELVHMVHTCAEIGRAHV